MNWNHIYDYLHCPQPPLLEFDQTEIADIHQPDGQFQLDENVDVPQVGLGMLQTQPAQPEFPVNQLCTIIWEETWEDSIKGLTKQISLTNASNYQF